MIWSWNADEYGESRADGYLQFLFDCLEGAAEGRWPMRKISEDPPLYAVMMRPGRGHGHIAFVQLVEDQMTVLNIFHTAQNWQDWLKRSDQF
jgi:plasmid stabilization system protein ParE